MINRGVQLFCALGIALLTAVILTSFPAAAFAEDESIDYEDVAADAAEDLIDSVLSDDNYQSVFNFNSDADASYSLGEAISVYCEEEGAFALTNLRVWPIFAGEDIVASLVEMRDPEEGSTYRLSTADSKAIDSFYRQAPDGVIIIIENCAAILTSSNHRSVNLEELIDVESFVKNIDRKKFEIESSALSHSVQSDLIPLQTSLVGKTTRSSNKGWLTWITINVPLYKQLSPVICWATCASCVGFCMTHHYISGRTLSHAIHGRDSVGTVHDTIYALSLFKYDSAHLPVRSAYLSKDLDQTQVGRWIVNRMPIIAALTISNSDIGHMVVVCGFAGDDLHSLVRIMDPAKGHCEVLERNSKGIPLSHKLGYTWDRGSIVLAGWNLAPGTDKFQYFELDGTIRK